ncbi:hypothetical protein ACJ41O_010827 [Fusarium nematophilum]
MYIRRADASPGSGPVVDHSLDGESRSMEVCIVLAVFSVLSTIVVALRSYTRLVLLRALGFDDGIMLVAQLLTIGTAVAIGLETKYGLGFHTWVQPREYFIPYMKAFYSSVVVYNIAMCAVKIAILLQYRRIFASRTMQRITFGGVIFMAAWAITLCFLLTLTCIPVAKFWNSTLPGRCLNSLIICTCIISIIRLQTLKLAASTSDPNWDNVGAATWSFIELNTAIIATCLPTIRPIFAKAMPRLFGTSVGRSQDRYQYGAYVQAASDRSVTNSNTKATLSRSESTRSLQEHNNIELSAHSLNTMPPPGGYHIRVSITGGEKQNQFPKDAESQHSSQEDEVVRGGIQTRTVVMQQVEHEMGKQEK